MARAVVQAQLRDMAPVTLAGYGGQRYRRVPSAFGQL